MFVLLFSYKRYISRFDFLTPKFYVKNLKIPKLNFQMQENPKQNFEIWKKS